MAAATSCLCESDIQGDRQRASDLRDGVDEGATAKVGSRNHPPMRQSRVRGARPTLEGLLPILMTRERVAEPGDPALMPKGEKGENQIILGGGSGE